MSDWLSPNPPDIADPLSVIKMKKTIFISYSWSTKKEADKIASDLAIVGLKVMKDNLSLKKLDDIKGFMERISESDYTLILVSEKYLKSRNCMYEVLQLFKSDENLNQIIPILCGSVKMFDIQDRLSYTKFWQEKTDELQESLKHINPINSKEIIIELKIYQDISYRIGEFLEKLNSINLIKYEELANLNYSSILNFLGVSENRSHLVELIQINLIPNPRLRLLALKNYKDKFGQHGLYKGILARTESNLGNYNIAISHYLEAIELVDYDYESLNNLGYIYDKRKEDYEKAEHYYKKSLELNPQLSIARLNLACLYDKLGKDELAEELNMSILEYDRTNEKAHSNLGNIYRARGGKKNLDIAEEHYKTALKLNPKFINGLFNYANFLKAERGKFKQGNRIYKKLKKIVNNEDMKKAINILIKTKKG